MKPEAKSVIDRALSGITFAWSEGAKHFTSVPVQYPSGSLCTVEMNIGLHEAHVSDMAAGFHEAEDLCDETSYPKFAEAEARKRGLSFENGAIFVRSVDLGQLGAAIVAVANASACAAHAAIRHDSEQREALRRDAIFCKVKAAFPNAHVHRTLKISGSRAAWEVHNVVDLHDNRKAVFEHVTMHQVSIATKFTMFSDLVARGGVILNAVFDTPMNLDPKAQMLQEVANIIGIDDSIEAYRSKAA